MVRAVVQRVRRASVSVDERAVGSIGLGLAILVGIEKDDTDDAVRRVAAKIAALRIFEDAGGKMNLAASDVEADMLVVSQFTLYADVRRGRRPSFVRAADPELGRRLYEAFVSELRHREHTVATGEFGAKMLVSLENDGPVTILLDSSEM